MRSSGRQEEGCALDVAMGCWLRNSETFAPRAEDVVMHVEEEGAEAGQQQAVLRIGVAERGEAAKTGMAGSTNGFTIYRRYRREQEARKGTEAEVIQHDCSQVQSALVQDGGRAQAP